MAEKAAREAGAMVKEAFYRGKKVNDKSSFQDMVTETDRAAETLLCALLLEARPHFK